MRHSFAICALMYGDYPRLAERCVKSICSINRREVDGQFAVGDVRIGFNEASEATQTLVKNAVRYAFHGTPHGFYYEPKNIYKYPMMRRMFYNPRIETDYTIWFDDDSYLREPGDEWLDYLSGKFFVDDADMVGSVLYCRLKEQQHRWIQNQPWYDDEFVEVNHPVRFAAGGWWCIRTELIYKHDWPPKDITHRGGDVMLGELCRQQAYKLIDWDWGVAVNADEAGNSHQAPRRGYDELPVGWNYKAETV